MSQGKEITPMEFYELINSRLNRLSGGGALQEVRRSFLVGVEDPNKMDETFKEAVEKLSKINQPTLGRNKIVQDIVELVSEYAGVPDTEIDDADKTEKVDKTTENEDLDETTEENVVTEDEDDTDVDISLTLTEESVEETKEDEVKPLGKKKKLSKAALKKNPDLDYLEAGDFIYVEGDIVTGFIVSEKYATSDLNVTFLDAGDVFMFDTEITLQK